MKKLLFVFTCILFSNSIFGQDTLRKQNYRNAISFEALGNGVLFSFNYERYVIKNKMYKLSSRYGVTYFPQIDGFSDYSGPGVVLELNNLLGNSKNNLEIGFGINCVFFYKQPDNFVLIYSAARIGYKFESSNKYLFRVGFTPIIPLNVINNYLKAEVIAMPWIGIGFGKMF